MRARIIKIGNSRGIRIPKVLIEETGLGEEVEIEGKKGRLIVRPAGRPRMGWDAAFKKMADAGDDALLDGEMHIPTSWEETDWEW
jgi:antitoxin MazE